MYCPSTNNDTVATDDSFFSPDGIHWDAHRIGWAVAGGCAALTTLITLFTVTMHATHYQYPPAQRQVMRVLLMPAVYGIVSFFSYRYYKEYEYYILAETAYEAITLSAFLMLLMQLVRMGTTDQEITTALKEKDKQNFPFPFNFLRFRASKPYFWHALSFSVMQYVILRPLISIIAIICEYYNVLCPEEYSVHFAEVYLDAVDFVSISVALYGLIVFYVLCKGELKGKRPLSKFLAIKLIVFFTFYQSFLFSILQSHGVIKGTALWTATNVSDGLSALCTTVEMVFFSIYMGWAYNWTDYTNPDKNPYQRKTNFKTYLQAIWDTINLSDFAVEVWLSTKFLFDFLQGKPGTHSQPTQLQKTFMPETMGEKPQELSAFNAYGQKEGQNAMNGSAQPPEPRRTPSGNLYPMIRSPDSYHRLQDAPGGEEGHYAPETQYASATSPSRVHATTTSPQKSTSAAGSYYTADQRSPRNQSSQQQSLSPSKQSPYYAPDSVSSQYATPTSASAGQANFPSAHPTGQANFAQGQQISPGSNISPVEWNNALDNERRTADWPEAYPNYPAHAQQGRHPFAQTASSPYAAQQQSSPLRQQQQQRQQSYSQSQEYDQQSSPAQQIRHRQHTADEQQYSTGYEQENAQTIPGNPRLY